MGLLSGVVNFLRNNPVGKKIESGIETVATVLTSPIASIKDFKAAKEATVQQAVNNPAAGYKKIALGYGAAIATVATAGAATGAFGAAAAVGTRSVLTSLIPATTKGKLIATAVVPVVASAIIQNPAKAIQVPSKILNFQTNVGGLIANPTLANAKEVITENPVISGLVAAGGIAAIGGGIGLAANTLATYNNSQATKANSLASSAPSDVQSYTSDPTKTIQIINQLPPSLAPAVVAPSEEAPAGSKTPTKKKKTTKKKAKKKAKTKKKTRRSKKKTSKKKKKSIKRRTS